MFNKVLLLAAVVLCMTGKAKAQLQPCSTDEHYWELLKQYPQLGEYEKQFEAQMNLLASSLRTTAAVDTNTYDIPLVVHVVHDYGVENISDNVIYDAAAYWAIVYMKQNPDTATVIAPFIPYIGNPKMRLHLATKDPNGNPTKGVVRHMSYLTTVASDQAKYVNWPNNKYINIWIINAFGPASAGAAAYAIYPSTAAFTPYYDGVICLYSYTNYDKTIPHELGHVLNLQHVWGNTNAPAVACGNDQVDDTPPTKGHNPVGCVASALYDTTCAGGYLKHYTAVVGGGDSIADYPDTVNAQNIMDYTYCENMFTKGQCVRMRTALTGTTAGRNNLITAANLAATGALAPRPDLPPVADFIVNKAQGAGLIADNRSYFLTTDNAGSFSFKNTSWNDTITSVNWTFSNGATTPTSTTLGALANKFSVPGWVTVSITATSNAGSNTLTDDHAVYAADPAPAGGLSYAQSFNDPTLMANWPMMNYYKNQFKWETYTGAGVDDNQCVRYHSYDTSDRIFGTAVGDFDDMFTPAIDLSGLTDNLYFNFFTSAAYTNRGISAGTAKVYDSLEIDASITGGARWVKIAGFGGSQLANQGISATEYQANATATWVPRAVTIPTAYRTGNTFFRFRYRPGNTGNNLYLDNFQIAQFPAGVKELVNSGSAFNIYPNPTNNDCNLVFKTGNDGVVTYSVKDLTGKIVYHNTRTFMPNSVQQTQISRSVMPAAGMYFVTVTVDGNNMTQKLVVY